MKKTTIKMKLDEAMAIEGVIERALLQKPEQYNATSEEQGHLLKLMHSVCLEVLQRFRLKTAIIGHGKLKITITTAQSLALLMLFDVVEIIPSNEWEFALVNNFHKNLHQKISG